ncbi:MAG: NEW3 domain-containing protein [Chloroflexota bacterium]
MRIGNKIRWLLFIAVVISAIFPTIFAAGQTIRKDLVIRFAAGSYPYNVKIKQNNIFYLEIENIGNQALSNIRLSANAPEGWFVEINPPIISYLSTGSVQTVDANVKPAINSDKKEYQLTFIAEGDGIRKVMTTWVRVEDSQSMWLWIGIGIGVIVIAGFIFVFLKLGKQ